MKRNLKRQIFMWILVVGLIASNFTFMQNVAYAEETLDKELEVQSEETKESIANEKNLLEEQQQSNEKINEKTNPEETVRVIVELKEDALAEKDDKEDIISEEYTEEVKEEEEKILDNQENIIEKVEQITGTKIISQTAYLVNSFSIDAKRKDIEEIEKCKNVARVYEATKFKKNMTEAVEVGNVSQEWNCKSFGYMGTGTVVAIIDDGINWEHKDMTLPKGAKTKFSKSDWEEKITDFGYGKYYSDKVPFGYNYSEKNENLENKEGHGAHVAGIISANGEIMGVAPNSQVISMKVFDEEGYGMTDSFVKAIEDAVKLKVDVINISIGSLYGIPDDDNFFQSAIKRAEESGVVVCIAAGNEGAGDISRKDFATINSPAVEEKSIAVGSVNNNYYDGLKSAMEKDISKGFIENISDIENDEIVVSNFSSWGPTLKLGIKPEIVAPGGYIKSLGLGKDDYSVKKGTSMATPFMSGSSAIMVEAVRARGYNFENNELSSYIKNAFLNTAKPVIDTISNKKEDNVPYSIRKQGAGLIDVFNAVKTNVIATYNDVAKVELGSFSENSKEITINLKNYGKKDASFSLQKEKLYTNEEKDGNISYLKEIENASIEFEEEKITVKAGESLKIKATISITEDLKTDRFVEGYINLKGEDACSLSLPVLGFFGDWEKENIIEKSAYDEDLDISEIDVDGDNIKASFLMDKKGSYIGTKEEKVKRSNTKIDKSKITNKKVINVDEEAIISDVKNDEKVYFEFTPKEKGYYTFKSLSEDGDEKQDLDGRIAKLINGEYELSHYQNDISYKNPKNWNFLLEQELEAGKTYLYEVVVNSLGTDNIAKVELKKSDGENCSLSKEYVSYFENWKIFRAENSVFSPDDNGVFDEVVPVLALRRRCENLKISVLDENKNVIRQLQNSMNVREINSAYSGKVWDGKIYDKSTNEMKMAKDGQYYIQIEAKLYNDSEKVQKILMPIKLDLTKPKLETKLEINENGNYNLKFLASDENGLDKRAIVYDEDNEVITSIYLDDESKKTEDGYYNIALGKIKFNKIHLDINDMAGNVSSEEFEIGNSSSQSAEVIETSTNENDSTTEKDEIEVYFSVDDNVINDDYIVSQDNKNILQNYYALLNENADDGFRIHIDLGENGLGKINFRETSILVDMFNIGNDYVKVKKDEDGKFYFDVTKKMIKNGICEGCVVVIVGDKIQEFDFMLTKDEDEYLKYVKTKVGDTVEENGLINTIFESQNILNETKEEDKIIKTYSKSELNEDGTVTFKGKMKNSTFKNTKISINDIEVKIRNDLTFEVNVPIDKGISHLKINIMSKYGDLEKNVLVITNEIKVDYMLPETDENGVINTDNDSIDVTGIIITAMAGYDIQVNGDEVYTSYGGSVTDSRYGELLKEEISIPIKLDDGDNIIKIVISDKLGNKEEKTIKVRRK